MKKIAQIMFTVCTLVVSVAGSAFAAPEPPITAVPEPGTFVLLGLGAAGLVIYKKIKK